MRDCLYCIHTRLWTSDAQRCSHSWHYLNCCSHTKSGFYPSLDVTPAIQCELVAKRRTAAMASLPTGEPRNGLGVLRPLTTDESAIRRQGITNMTSRDSSQWLNANPAYLFNRMNNKAFTLAYKRRSMRRLWALAHTACVALKLTSSETMYSYAKVLPFVTKYGTLATTMLTTTFAIYSSPVRLPDTTTLPTANHSWIATSNASMSLRPI